MNPQTSTQIVYRIVIGERRTVIPAAVATDDAVLRATYGAMNAEWADEGLFDIARTQTGSDIEISFVPHGTLISTPDDPSELAEDVIEPAHDDAPRDDAEQDTADDLTQPGQDEDAGSSDAQGEPEDTADANAAQEDGADAAPDAAQPGTDPGGAAPKQKRGHPAASPPNVDAELTVIADGVSFKLKTSFCKTDRGLLTALAARDKKFAQHTLWQVSRADGIQVRPARVERYELDLNGARYELASEVAAVDANLRAFIAEAAPKLADSHIERSLADGVMVIRPVKHAEVKGRDRAASPVQDDPVYTRVLRTLERAPSSLNAVLALHDAVTRATQRGRMSVATTLMLSFRVRSALERGQREHDRVNALIRTLEQVPAEPSRHVPVGF